MSDIIDREKQKLVMQQNQQNETELIGVPVKTACLIVSIYFVVVCKMYDILLKVYCNIVTESLLQGYITAVWHKNEHLR